MSRFTEAYDIYITVQRCLVHNSWKEVLMLYQLQHTIFMLQRTSSMLTIHNISFFYCIWISAPASYHRSWFYGFINIDSPSPFHLFHRNSNPTAHFAVIRIMIAVILNMTQHIRCRSMWNILSDITCRGGITWKRIVHQSEVIIKIVTEKGAGSHYNPGTRNCL